MAALPSSPFPSYFMAPHSSGYGNGRKRRDLPVEPIPLYANPASHVRIHYAPPVKILEDDLLTEIASLSTLKTVNLMNCRNLTNRSLSQLAKTNMGIESLEIDDCNFSDPGIIILAHQCTNLRRLSIRNCSHITDVAITVLSRKCMGLEILDLSGCGKTYDIHGNPLIRITDAGISQLAKCTLLLELYLNDLPGVTDSSIMVLAERCTRLTHIDLRKCAITRVACEALELGNHDIRIRCSIGMESEENEAFDISIPETSGPPTPSEFFGSYSDSESDEPKELSITTASTSSSQDMSTASLDEFSASP